MSIEEKRREKFESFCVSEAGGYCAHHLERDEHGQYTILWEYWALWNAALDSVEIELPGLFIQQPEKLYPAKWIIASIESAGLKVKS